LKKLLLIDGNSILHRAYHAWPPFKTQAGETVNAVYGFSSMLLTLIKKEEPDYLAVTFDMKTKTFRHKEYKEYKATRSKAPDDLYGQIPRIKEILNSFQIPFYEIEGFEADDLLGSFAVQMSKKGGIDTYIVTGDRDALQLVNDTVKVIAPIRGFSERITYDRATVLEKYGVSPEQIIDIKGLQGDPSDNIKGVAGVGAKTATKLIQEYGTIEKIYENLDKLKGKLKENLENNRESAFLSKRIATIVTDLPKELEIDKCKVHEYKKNDIENLFFELEFKSLINKLNNFDRYYTKKKNEDNFLQGSLF